MDFSTQRGGTVIFDQMFLIRVTEKDNRISSVSPDSNSAWVVASTESGGVANLSEKLYPRTRQ